MKINSFGDFITEWHGVSSVSTASHVVLLLKRDYTLAKEFDKRTGKTVVAAVAKEARKSGTARL